MKLLVGAIALIAGASFAQANHNCNVGHGRGHGRMGGDVCQTRFGSFQEAKASCAPAGYSVSRLRYGVYDAGYICACGTFDPSKPNW